jgi:hypothetical protein
MALGGMGRNIGELLSRGYCNFVADRASAVLDALAVGEGCSVDLIASVRLCMSLSLMCLAATVRLPPFFNFERGLGPKRTLRNKEAH